MPNKRRSTSASPSKSKQVHTAQAESELSLHEESPRASLSRVFAQVVASPNTKNSVQTRQDSGINKTNERRRAYDQEFTPPKPTITKRPRLASTEEEAALIKLAKTGDEQAVLRLIDMQKRREQPQKHAPSIIPDGFNELDFDDIDAVEERERNESPLEKGRNESPKEKGRNESTKEKGRNESPKEKGRNESTKERERKEPTNAKASKLARDVHPVEDSSYEAVPTFRDSPATNDKGKRRIVDDWPGEPIHVRGDDSESDTPTEAAYHNKLKAMRAERSPTRRKLQLLRELLEGSDPEIDEYLDTVLRRRSKDASGSLRQAALVMLVRYKEAIKDHAGSEWRIRKDKLIPAYLNKFAVKIDSKLEDLFADNHILQRLFHSAIREAFWRLNDTNKRKFCREFDKEYTEQISEDALASFTFLENKEQSLALVIKRTHGDDPTPSDLEFYGGKPWEEAVQIVKGIKKREKKNVDSSDGSDGSADSSSSEAPAPRKAVGPSPLARTS